MGEVWAAALVTVGGAVVSGYAASKKDKADKKENRAMTQKEAELNAQTLGYEGALENFYMEKERFQKQRGLDEFRKFSTMGTWAPGYSDNAARVADPVMPKFNDFAVEQPEAQGGGGKGGKSIFDKRVDLHTKPLSKIKDLF